MKLCSRKIASGRAKIVWAIQTCAYDLRAADGEPAGEEAEQRHECHLDRHDLQREHADEQPVLAPEVDPGEGIRREAGEHQREDRRRDGDGERVYERSGEVELAIAGRENLGVVVEREPGVLEDRPPTGRVDQRRGPERRDEQAEGRGGPEDGDDERGDGGATAGEAPLGALDRALGLRALFAARKLALGRFVDRQVDWLYGAHRISLCFLIWRAL
jgi:hypothetical protein